MIAARSRSADQRYYGVAEALVVEVNDPEHEGRVKVQFPWFDSDMVSEWCRVCQLYAGNGYGTVWVPEVRDEVLVAFIHGDMRLPIILGGLYNGQDKPATWRERDKDEKLIRTKAGHQILMRDTDGEYRLTIETPGGHLVDMDDQAPSVSVRSSGGHEVCLDDAGGKILIKHSGGSSIEMQGSKITVTAATVCLSASSVKLGGDAATQSVPLGETLMALFNLHVHTTTLPGTPTTPPVTPMTPAQLSQVTKTV